MRVLKIAKILTVVFFGIAVVFWIWPSIASRSVWLVAFWASVGASLWVSFHSLPGFVMGYLFAPRGFGIMFARLALVDFGSESSSTRRFILWIPLCALVLGVSWKFGLLNYAVVLAIYFLSTEINYLIERLTPPLVLYLGSSDPAHPQLSSSLVAASLRPRLRRVVTILKPTDNTETPAFVRTISYRTHDDMWDTMLDELLELNRIIVVDLRRLTDPVEFELDRVFEKHFAYKTLILVDASQVADIGYALQIVNDDGAVSLTDYNLLVNILFVFCDPRMRLPTADFPMSRLINDLRMINPHIPIQNHLADQGHFGEDSANGM